MRKTAYRKDVRREISHTFGRFICIFLIVALGVAFFTGIRVSEPDMMKSADRLFDETSLMDVQIISTGGLTDDDLDAIRAIEGVDIAEGAYSADMLEHTEGEQNVIKVMSVPEKLNTVKLLEGRMPEKDNECLLDSKLTSFYSDYKIGDSFAFDDEHDEDEDGVLSLDEFTIVGIVTSPMYIDFSRGSSKLGSGSVLGYVLVPGNVFTQDYYSSIYITGKGFADELSYTDAYDDKVDELVEKVKEIAEERCKAREESVRDTIDSKLSEAETEYEDAKREVDEELQKARKELDDGYVELENARKDYEEGLSSIDENREKLTEAEAEIAENEEKLLKAKQELEKTGKELESARKELNVKWAEYDKKVSEAEALMNVAPEMYQAAMGQLAYAYAMLDASEDEYKRGNEAYEKACAEIADAEDELINAKKEFTEGKDKLAEVEEMLETAPEKIAQAELDLADGEKEYADAKAEAEEKLADAEIQINDAKKAAADFKGDFEWYVLDRNYVSSVAEFGLNANKIGAIGKVFPVIFFLVAILVCLTTMTRMVEEERTQIGTMKALGYSDFAVTRKYLSYCLLASVLGSVFGAAVGEYVLPYCIINAYYILYNNIPYLHLGIDAGLSIYAGVVACACTTFATYLACARATREKAAELMRPVAPLPGKRVFVENIGFIWKRLNFSMKASVRNLLRYTKRFMMTVVGIGGCMALMMVGFGLHDSIFTIIDNQFFRIMVYDGVVSINNNSEEAVDELLSFVGNNPVIKEHLLMHQTSTDVGANDTEKSVTVVVPKDVDSFGNYIYLGDRKSKERYSLRDYPEGVIINEKLANLLDVKVGDSIYVKDDQKRIDTVVSGITENYVNNYVYMTPEYYARLFNEAPEYNVLFFNEKDGILAEAEAEFSREVLKLEASAGINYSQTSADTIYDMMKSLNFVVYVLVIAAALLAFVVLYNLSNINVNERRRELATLKVLGFYDGEVSAYVYRENIMLTVIGTAIGVVFGIFLHRYVILTAEVDMTFFGRQIKPLSYLYSVCFTFAFSMLVNWVMHFKLKKIDMVESLKSIE